MIVLHRGRGQLSTSLHTSSSRTTQYLPGQHLILESPGHKPLWLIVSPLKYGDFNGTVGYLRHKRSSRTSFVRVYTNTVVVTRGNASFEDTALYVAWTATEAGKRYTYGAVGRWLAVALELRRSGSIPQWESVAAFSGERPTLAL